MHTGDVIRIQQSNKYKQHNILRKQWNVMKYIVITRRRQTKKVYNNNNISNITKEMRGNI